MATAANEEIVGDYRVIQDKEHELGEGSFGKVYLAEHVSIKGQFAAAKKTIAYKEYLKIAECEKEKDLLLNRIPPHENIIKVYDVVLKEYVQKGVPMVDIWLLMEYAPLGNLQEFAQEHELTVEEKVELMLDCALGVQHLHNCKPEAIAHRDIKPANVVITGSVKKPIACLCDFGEGKAIGKKSDFSSVTMRSVTGTPKYAAPEQQVLEDGHASYDKSVDVYSLGVTFGSLLDSSPGKVMVPRTLDEIQNRPSDTPLHKAVKDIIQNMVQLKPSDRIPIGDVVARLRVCKSLGYGRIMKDMGESPRRGQAPDAPDWMASDPGSPQPEAFNDWIRDTDLQRSWNLEHFSASGRSAKMRAKEHDYEEMPSPVSLQQREFEKTASTNEAPVPQAPLSGRPVLDEAAHEAASCNQTLKASPILRTFLMKQACIDKLQARYKVRIQMSADGLTVAGDNQDDLAIAHQRLREEKENIEEEEDIKRSSQIPDAMATEIGKIVRSAADNVACVLDEEAMVVLAMGPGAQHFIEEVNTLIVRVGEYEVIDAAEAKGDEKEVSGRGHEYMETLHIDINIMYFAIASKMTVDTSLVRVTFLPLEGMETAQVTLKSNDKERLKDQVAKFRAACEQLAGTLTKKKITLEAMGALDRNIENRFPDVHVDLQEDFLMVELIGPTPAVEEAEEEIIRLSKEPVRPKTSSRPQSPSQSIGSSADSVEPMSFWTLANPKRRLHVHALVHDITRMQVDVIVNAANEKLQHGDGIARKIAEVGGQELEDDCKAYMMWNFKIKVTNHYISKPGRLPCKHVMHAVGPVWSKEGLVSQLQETFRKCLMAASDKNFKSIAIPPISAGIFGFHPVNVAMIMAKAVADFARGLNHNLSDIYLVDISSDTVQILQKQLQNHDILRPEVCFTGGDAVFSLPNMPHQGRRTRVLDEEEHVVPGKGAMNEVEKTRAAMADLRTQDPMFASAGPQFP